MSDNSSRKGAITHMSRSINFGKPLTSAPNSFEDSLRGLAKPGIASTFRCYFPPELVFEASVQGLYCWGDNELGGVGDGTTDDQLTPVKIFEDVSDVSISSENIAAIKNNGDLYCWGFNRFGQVGNGTTADQLTPVSKIIRQC